MFKSLIFILFATNLRSYTAYIYIINNTYLLSDTRDLSVGTATDYGMDGQDLIP
jgi:hypothetical protein